MDTRRRISFNMNTGGDTSGPINTDNYMTILALEDGLTASLSTNACQYCVDGDGNWIDLSVGTTTQAINQGQTLSFKGNLTPSSSSGIGTFTINKNCNLEGNCMSLLFGDDAANNSLKYADSYTFYRLFANCTTIIQVSKSFLPSLSVRDWCYCGMFDGCTGLTQAPELPATTLTSSCCYRYMFAGCTSLTSTPELPATTLADSCYGNMFAGCTSLTTAPELPATKLGFYCYEYMFAGCSGLTTAPELPATTLANYCYQYMFYNCSSLTTAPSILPATTLASYCYYYMFYGCTSLTSAPELPATTLANNCYRSMFSSCYNLTTAPELPATKLDGYCYDSMFQYCSGLTTAPELPATKLYSYCYQYMFRGCSNLNYIKMLATDISASGCLNGWVTNVSSTGTFVKNPAMTSLPTATLSNGYAGIPSGWTVVDDN